MTCDLGKPMPKGTVVTIRTNNGGESTAPLALDYRPSYCAYLAMPHGRTAIILAERIVSIRKVTLAMAKGLVRSLGFTLNKREGELRLCPIGAAESHAYYTSDIGDAIGTAWATFERCA